MLCRVIGEDIKLETHCSDKIGAVRMDPSQVEQIVMNLAVNARDAMPGGGKLTIETQNVELGQEYIEHHGTVTPGPYVMLAISDTGEGMNTDTRLRIFEPFFTTKKLGKGTGLGLATVYGIVKQSEGYIWVYSEPGQGTTFKVYLPRTEGAHTTTDQLPALREAGPRGGGEVLLVVEDEEAILRALERLLTRQGYTVLTAKDPQHAIEQVERFGEPIDLLLTDVVLPGGAGREIADTLRAAHPAMVVLYMSGYTDNSIVHHGVLDEGTPFLQKPFTPATALKKIRALLRGVEHETDEGEVE
jgi:CheY-like chemotaxis protein